MKVRFLWQIEPWKTPELRDLAGAVALGKAGAFGSMASPLLDMTIRMADPVFQYSSPAAPSVPTDGG